MKGSRKVLKYMVMCTLGFVLIITFLGHTDIGNRYVKSDQGELRQLVIGDNRIRYTQAGAGKDILFIHGTPGSIEDWQPILKSLAGSYRVTAFDRLGHGYSTEKNYHYSLSDNADLVHQVIDKLQLESPMIVGHSYGGSTVANLVANHYNDGLQYMIIDSPLFAYEASKIYKWLSIPIIGKGIGFVANYTIAEKQIEDGVASAFANQSRERVASLTKERKQIWLQPKVLHAKAKESVNYQSGLDEISHKYKGITADVIIVTGENAETTFRSDCQKFSDIVRSDTLVILENTGHYVQFDQTDAIIQLINATLQ